MTSPSVIALRTQSDDRLVALAQAGHERAFEAIVDRYRRPLLRHCRRFLPEARAEDALQQALVSAWSALARGDEVRDLRPWLYRIVHNTALNALRSNGFDYDELHDLLTASEAGSPSEIAERSALVRQTLAGMAALPDRQREALLQIAVEGRSQDEVAAGLGLTEGAVRQLVHRARSSLRAAATAVMPLPLATALAASGARGDLVSRMAELATGAGASATLAKAGAVAVLAGGAIAGPSVVNNLDRSGAGAPPAARAASVSPERASSAARKRSPDASGGPAAPATMPSGRRGGSGGDGGGAQRHDGTATTGEDRSGRRRSGGSDDDGDDRSGTTESGSGSSGSGSGARDDGGGGGDDRSGPGGGGIDDRSGTSGSGTSGSGTSGGGDDGTSGSGETEDHSGPGSGELTPTTTPVPTVTSDDLSGSDSSNSGPSSDGSGSGGGGSDDKTFED